jgi:AraC-like DNA-binding protein
MDLGAWSVPPAASRTAAQTFGKRAVEAERPAALSNASIVQQTERWVLEALPQRLGEEKLAARLNLPVPVLRHAFRTCRSETIYSALRRLRVEAACETLRRDPTLSQGAVAHRYGFGSLAHFRQAWRWAYGKPFPLADESGPDAGTGDAT